MVIERITSNLNPSCKLYLKKKKLPKNKNMYLNNKWSKKLNKIKITKELRMIDK